MKRITSLVLVVLVLLASSTPVSAKEQTKGHWVYRSPDLNCTHLESTIGSDQTRQGGIFRSTVIHYMAGWSPWGMLPCLVPSNVPAGWARSKLEISKWTGEVWVHCLVPTGWAYNPADSDGVYLETSYPTAQCGEGWYNTLAFGDIFFNNTWWGGGLYSDSYYLPSSGNAMSSVPQEMPPPLPEWANADGTVDANKMPDCLNVSNADGTLQTNPDGMLRCIPSQFKSQDNTPPTLNIAALDTSNTRTIDGVTYVQIQTIRP